MSNVAIIKKGVQKALAEGRVFNTVPFNTPQREALTAYNAFNLSAPDPRRGYFHTRPARGKWAFSRRRTIEWE